MTKHGNLFLILAVFVIILWQDAASADTASFLQPSAPDPADITALSTAGDNSGFTVGQSQSLQLLFDQPFVTTRSDRVSIFTLPPSAGGRAIGTIRIGRYVNGQIQFVVNRRFNSNGRQYNFTNGIASRCEALGGCNFIEIITNRTQRGAEGVQIDYIQVNGEVVSVVAATPEPATWALMIIGFIAVAWRAKSLRKPLHKPKPLGQCEYTLDIPLTLRSIPPPFDRLDYHTQLKMS